MLDGKGGINFKLNKGLGGNHGDCLDVGAESDTSESSEATETNGPKEDWYRVTFQNLTVCI